MASTAAPHRYHWLAGQIVIALLAIGLAAAPPAGDRLLLVPLDGRPAARMFALALDHHMLPLSTGPLPGSMIVRVDGVDAIRALLRDGVLPLPVQFGGCSDARTA